MTDYKLVPVEPTPRLLPCPFCGGDDIGNRYIETYSCDSSYDIFGCNACGAGFNNDDQSGPSLWNRRAAAPAVQGEPVGEAGSLPGTKGFTTAVFESRKVPEGTKLYTAPQPAVQGEPEAWVTADTVDGQTVNGKPRRIWWENNEGVGMPLYAAPQPPFQLPDLATDPDDSDEVASLWDHGFKRGWNSCLDEVARLNGDRMANTELGGVKRG